MQCGLKYYRTGSTENTMRLISPPVHSAWLGHPHIRMVPGRQAHTQRESLRAAAPLQNRNLKGKHTLGDVKRFT